MDQNAVWRQIRVGAKEIGENMTDEQLYTSEAYAAHVQATVDGLTKDLNRHIIVSLEHDAERETVAFTDGNRMHANTANDVASWYSLPASRFSANMGIVYHELAHIRFHDFRADEIAQTELEAGRLYGRAPEGIDDDSWDEMCDALKKPEYIPIFKTLRHELINCIIDAHDEERMCDTYGGVIARCIQMAASSLEGQLTTLEHLTEEKVKPLTIMTDLVLQFARFGEIFTAEEQTLYANEYAVKLAGISPSIERAAITDDPAEMYSQVNKILLFLWPYIKDALEEAEKEKKNDSSQAGNQNGQQQGGGGQGQQNKQGSGNSTPSQKAVQQVLNQIAQAAQNAGSSQMPANQKASSVAKKATKEAQSGKGKQEQKQQSTGAAAGSDQAAQQQADNAIAGILHTIITSAANDMAEVEMTQDLKSKLIAEVATMDRSSTHKGHPLDVHREVMVTESDKALYTRQMDDIQQYSKRLAKLMQQELKDLQDGDVRRGRVYGRDIVASDMWRPDCRYFSDTKLPQDLPDMAVAVLVDQSGSMMGERMDAAMKASMLLFDYAERVHVPVAVYGHNVTQRGRVNLFVYTDYLKSDKRDKYRLAKMSTGGCNRDGAALEVVASLLGTRPERTKLLIIISDGKPNDSEYGGDSAARDIAGIVARNRRRGIEIIAAAIGDDKPYLKKIYGDQFLDITDLSAFPKAMVKIVKKRLKV